MRMRTYPGRLTREEWLQRTIAQRRLLARRAESDLLRLWRSCNKKTCRRAHTCLGDELCSTRPWLADFKNPNFGRPDYVCSFQFPKVLRNPSAFIDNLPFWPDPPSPELMLQACAAEAGEAAAAALRRVLRLQRRRRARSA